MTEGSCAIITILSEKWMKSNPGMIWNSEIRFHLREQKKVYVHSTVIRDRKCIPHSQHTQIRNGEEEKKNKIDSNEKCITERSRITMYGIWNHNSPKNENQCEYWMAGIIVIFHTS